jgi:hypothetical protein
MRKPKDVLDEIMSHQFEEIDNLLAEYGLSKLMQEEKKELLEEIKQSVEDGNDWDTVIDEHLKELE